MKFKVTLKAELRVGILYWVADIDSDSDENAVAAAEALFLEAIDEGADWAFTDYDVAPSNDSDSR